MVAVNICFTFNEYINNKLIEINRSILNNDINFNTNHLPHITILQFYTSKKNIIEIKKKLEELNYDINNFIIENCDLKIDKYQDKYIYYLLLHSKDFHLIFNKVLNIFKNFIQSDNIELQEFIESINYQVLPNLVNNYYKQSYNPHITIGINQKIQNLSFQEISLKKDELQLGLFYVGDYGTAIPI